MIWAKFVFTLLGICFVQGLRVSTTRISARNLMHKPRGSFTVARPGASRISASVNAATKESNNTDLASVRDIVYMAMVTLAGIEYAVQIDTGSSDLWIRSNMIVGSQTSDVLGNITYGTGWAAGPISRANVSFAGFDVSSQAFMLATSANNPILNWGADGLLGLGLNSLSTVDHLVNNTGNSWGRTLLYNIFAQSPKMPNYIAFLLQRSENNLDAATEGSFTIGELEPEYEPKISATEAIPIWPTVNPTRWSVLLDSYDTTGAASHTLSSTVSGVPSGKAVALLDSGTTYSYASEEFCKNIYASIPGATFSSALGQWVVPCKEEVNLGLIIGGRRFPIHPLDIITPSLSSSDNTTCYGTFVPQSFSVGAGEFDILLGDMFLRNVYSLYDLGDFEDAQGTIMGNPYVKLLSITNGTTSSEEFHKARGGSANEANKISNAQASSGSVSSSSMASASSTAIDSLIRYAKILLGLLAISTTLLILGIGILVYYVFFKRKRDTPAAGSSSDPGLDLSGFGLSHLRPPGPAYQQVPSARSSLVP
ncbi:eukaryotic aspartyl protease [Rhizoctonia solani AG-3 Rhs1AP]|uniref:Eukaryotic aspartyl protease n=1 Tax=Rhizoctonia solani AG-3 Rhs1AP TaxID=1086054 RepID=X8JTW7_9AGAM|nr:eukaryotic aspartyl protease [Rhizoctonia solani AG-3 Rhs1AP]